MAYGDQFRRTPLAQMLNQQAAAQAAAISKANAQAAAAPNDRIGAARNEAYDLTRGRVGELRNDPVDQEILAALRARATGQDVPYNETVINALFGQQAEMNAQSQRNELDRIRAAGGSVTDPSYQAQLRAAQARSDANMQRARMGVDTQANLANYDARGRALGQTGAFNQLRNQGITSAEDRLLGLLTREEQTTRQPMTTGWTTTTMGAQQPRQTQSTNSGGFVPWGRPSSGAVVSGGRTTTQAPAQPATTTQSRLGSTTLPSPAGPPVNPYDSYRGGTTAPNVYDLMGWRAPQPGQAPRSSLPD